MPKAPAATLFSSWYFPAILRSVILKIVNIYDNNINIIVRISDEIIISWKIVIVKFMKDKYSIYNYMNRKILYF